MTSARHNAAPTAIVLAVIVAVIVGLSPGICPGRSRCWSRARPTARGSISRRGSTAGSRRSRWRAARMSRPARSCSTSTIRSWSPKLPRGRGREGVAEAELPRIHAGTRRGDHRRAQGRDRPRRPPTWPWRSRPMTASAASWSPASSRPSRARRSHRPPCASPQRSYDQAKLAYQEAIARLHRRRSMHIAEAKVCAPRLR